MFPPEAKLGAVADWKGTMLGHLHTRYHDGMFGIANIPWRLRRNILATGSIVVEVIRRVDEPLYL